MNNLGKIMFEGPAAFILWKSHNKKGYTGTYV